MEVQSGVQQAEPGSPRSGADQQNELDDRQTDASGRPSSDNHSKDAQPAGQKDDKKTSVSWSPVSCHLIHQSSESKPSSHQGRDERASQRS